MTCHQAEHEAILKADIFLISGK